MQQDWNTYIANRHTLLTSTGTVFIGGTFSIPIGSLLNYRCERSVKNVSL
jgi:hypothetical protein